jgi:hypothetical protein
MKNNFLDSKCLKKLKDKIKKKHVIKKKDTKKKDQG